jgi:hypothetical protein
MERVKKQPFHESLGEEINKASISIEWANREGRNTEDVEIPDKYKIHEKVFSEPEFPPSQPEDLVIKLDEKAPKSWGSAPYKMNDKENEALQEHIDEGQEKGYLVRSDSPFVTPTFFRDKVRGGLRPIYDYRTLNKWMIVDKYPLPRIESIFDQLHGTCLMTKFDMQDGYYCITSGCPLKVAS